MVVYDLALGLLARGHRPIVFSTRLGQLARDLQARTVPAIDNLADLGVTPDVIHAHHLPEAAMALLHFPATPAVYVCHDWDAWVDAPPRSPMVRRWVAVDEVCRDRLIARQGISPTAVRMIPNAIDLTRFQTRGPLPPRPARALAFSNYVSEDNILPAIRTACARAGVALDVVGLGVRNPHPWPEELLPCYDLVFAKARCALEAMAVGCAVILCDVFGCGGMVTAVDVNAYRRLNYGRRLLVRSPVTATTLERELARYDAADAAEVCRQVRAIAGLGEWFDAMLTVYKEAIAEPATEADRQAQFRFAAACLQQFVPYGHTNFEAKHRAELAEAIAVSRGAEGDKLRAALANESTSRAALQSERDGLQTELAREVSSRTALQNELADIRSSMTMRWRQRLWRAARICRTVSAWRPVFGVASAPRVRT